MRKARRFLSGLLVALLVILPVITGSTVTISAATNTLLNTYGATYGHVGTCINSWQLSNSSTLSHVKSQYNSITLENEMKPDALLGGSATLISVSEAKNLGYYIPSNYKESYVPKINFSTMDSVLKTCYQNGIGVRAHTLVWHSQTPTWFFRNGYSSNGGYVSTSTMDARMEMYIKTVMNHVYSGQYGSVVYAWDVVNEYLHATNSGWEAVYGKGGTSPAFVKKAFQFAHDTLDYYGLTNKVSLFYNDFNTYIEKDKVIALVNFINSSGKICNGVGMQSHLGTTYPSVDYYMTALKAFLNAGFEVQITELDVTNSSSSEQASYIYNLMKQVNTLKKNGAKITGVTIWGLSDDVSWITGGKNPLLFSKLNQPKDSYYKFLQAYTDAGLTPGSGSSSSGSSNSGSSSSGSNSGSTGSNTGSSNNGSTNTGSTSSASLSNGWYYIKNVNSGKYLQVTGSGASGANVELGNGTGKDAQKWYLTKNSDGTITLKNALGCMLDVTGGKSANATNIEVWSSNGKNSQKFMLKDAGNNRYGILTKVTNGSGCLDPANGEKSAGTNIQQYTYYTAAAQLWTFEKTSVSSSSNNNNNNNNNSNNTNTNNNANTNNSNVVIKDGWYYIKNLNAQKYLQVAGNKGANGTNVEISSGTGVSGQKWYVTNKGNGYVTLTNGQGYMLDVQYGTNEDGTNIQTYSSNNADAQQFKIASLGNNQYAILTKVSNDSKALDVYNFGTGDGTNVCQWTYYKNSNQIWYFEPCN